MTIPDNSVRWLRPLMKDNEGASHEKAKMKERHETVKRHQKALSEAQKRRIDTAQQARKADEIENAAARCEVL